MTQRNHSKYYSLWIGVSIVLLISLSIVFDVFNRFDRWIYDEVTDTSSFYQAPSPDVLLVEVSTGFDGLPVESWFKLLAQIQKNNPRVMAINLMPWNWSESDLQKALRDYPLIIGSMNPDQVSAHSDLTYFSLPPLDGQVYRQQRRQIHLNNQFYPSFESVVVDRAQGRAADNLAPVSIMAKANFFINFLGGADRMPTVDSERVLEGGLVETLVRDKVVLIGVKTPLMQQMLSPLGLMPYASYQAYALNTLINNNEIQIAPVWLVIGLVTLLVLVLFVAVLNIPDRFQLIMISGVILLILFLGYSSLFIFNYWVMPGYLLITILSILMALLFLRNRQNQQALQQMALNSAARIESHWLSENYSSSQVQWNHIANMVTQTLSLERTIFLERVPDDHRLREIKALNCSIDDISEMRRDYQRTPYTTAIEHGGALKLERSYIEGVADDEDHYLMPLTFAGNIQGFWAFTIKANAELDKSKLIDAVEQFALQIAELLYHWSEWGKNKQLESSPLVKLLKMQFEENSYESINHSINFLTHRLSTMERVMDGLETLAILYDLFGRVVHVNKSMTNMLTEINLMPYSMTAVDLIVNLSGCSMIEARNYLSYLILEQGSINIPVKNDGVKTGYMMVISALKSDVDENDIDNEMQPFELTGILCELIDMSQIRELYAQKENIVQHMSGWLRNDLSSISMACDLAQDKRLGDAKHVELMQLIKKKTNDLANNFEQVNYIVQQDLISKVTGYYPVDYIGSLHASIKEVQKMNKKKTKIQPLIPYCSPLVMASPKELRQVFSAIVGVLISDAVDESEVKIKILCNKDKVSFEFKNEGFGIPQEQLEHYLTTKDISLSNEFQRLQVAAQHIENWDGNFTAVSEIGVGMNFQFSLKVFVL